MGYCLARLDFYVKPALTSNSSRRPVTDLKAAMERFGAKLRALRKAKRMTLEEVGDLVGVSKSAVSQWEHGAVSPELPKLIELARFFGVSLAEMTGAEANDVSVDSELRMLDEATAHILRESFLASIRAMKPIKKS